MLAGRPVVEVDRGNQDLLAGGRDLCCYAGRNLITITIIYSSRVSTRTVVAAYGTWGVSAWFTPGVGLMDDNERAGCQVWFAWSCVLVHGGCDGGAAVQD